MAQYTSYETVGVKEDVSDIISNISPTKTPFQSSIGSDKCTQKLFEWQEDSLRAVATNSNVEGFTASDVTITPTTMRSNLTQIMYEAIKVAGSVDAQDAYGRAKESAYQIAKTGAQLKRDLEHAYVGTAQAKVTPTDNGTARVMAGFQAQLLNGGSGSLDQTDDFVLYTGGGATVPTEANVLDVLQHLYEAGSEATVIMVTPDNSMTVADFAKASGRYRTLDTSSSMKSQKTILNVVDLYVSPFGEQRIVLNRFLKSTNTLFYDPANWKKVVFRNWFRETLAKTGDNLPQMIVGEFSLKHKNYKASAAIVQAAGPTGF
jgi:hypothetical protein